MKNIVLTGLMGAGKTTVAKELKNLFPNFELVETDELITKSEGVSINEIFSKKGEGYFRTLEKQIIDKVLKEKNKIISLGGGSLNNNFDFSLAKTNSLIFYLKADVDILFERIKNNSDRPLLKCEKPKEVLLNLLKLREENYKKADYTVIVNNISPKQTAEKIKDLYNESTRNN